MSTEKIKKELVWIRQFIHKKDDENVVIRDANGKDIASWIDRVDAAIATPPAATVQEPVALGDEWTPCMKLPVVVHVRQQRLGESHVSTREGITPVKPDDLIMRGVSGEEYPIGRLIFEQTYTLDTTPPAQPAQREPAPGYCKHCKQYTIEEPLPAAQRKPLTKERIGQIIEQCQITLVNYCSDEKQTEFARAIEAAHGIRARGQA